LNREKKPWAHKSHLVAETRPGLKQRFPSRDIWEDTPDSLQLETTVETPQVDEKEVLSPPAERPTTGAVAYHQEKAAAGYPLGSEEGRATTGIAAIMKPQVPARPTRSKLSEPSETSQSGNLDRPSQLDGASPPIPMKSKPVVPARPLKPITRDSSENVPLTTVTSNSSAKSVGSDSGAAAAAAKPKPPVPSRPVGSKIAALQGGFMSDLNKRLQLGPQAPKKEEISQEEPEVETEKAPLVDARKGRARGPARRAPAKSPTPASEVLSEKAIVCDLCTPSTLWQIDPEEDFLHVSSISEDIKAASPEPPTLATNTAGEDLHPISEIAPTAEKHISLPSATEEVVSGRAPEAEKTVTSPIIEDKKSEPSVEPTANMPGSFEPVVADEDELAGSVGTIKPAEVVE